MPTKAAESTTHIFWRIDVYIDLNVVKDKAFADRDFEMLLGTK